MDLLALTLEPNLYANQRLRQEAQTLNLKLQFIDPLSISLCLSPLSPSAILQTNFKSPETGKFLWTRLTLSHAFHIAQVAEYFEQQGSLALNRSQSLLQLTSKWTTYRALAAQQLPIPLTYLSSPLSPIGTLQELPKLYGSQILKLDSGTQGLGVHLTTDKTLASSLGLYQQLGRPFLQQQFLPGQAVRSLNLFGKCLGAIEFSARKDDFRSNAHQGGLAQSTKLNPRLEELSLQIGKIFNLNFYAVDFILRDEEYFILDVNANPGFESFEKATEINVMNQLLKRWTQ